MSTALVARLDSAGDVLLAGPAVRAVAARHDRVVLLTGPRGFAAAGLLPDVDEIVQWQAPWVDFDSAPLTPEHVAHLIAELTRIAPERVYILTSFHQSPLPLALLCRLAGVPWIGAICEDYPGALLDLRHHVEPDVPEAQRALSLVQAAGCRLPVGDHGCLRVKPVTPLSAGLAAQIGPPGYIVFHHGAAVPARRPTPGRAITMTEALAQRGYRVVLTGGPDDDNAVAVDGAVDIRGKTTLAELAAVLCGASVAVVPNTGPAHLAAALGIPVVSLFAPVVPATQWAPYTPTMTLLGDQDAPCRGSRARDCPVPGHPCLDGISDAALVAAVSRWAGQP